MQHIGTLLHRTPSRAALRCFSLDAPGGAAYESGRATQNRVRHDRNVVTVNASNESRGAADNSVAGKV